MTVKELIEELQKYEQDTEVYINEIEKDYYGEKFYSEGKLHLGLIKLHKQYGKHYVKLGE